MLKSGKKLPKNLVMSIFFSTFASELKNTENNYSKLIFFVILYKESSLIEFINIKWSNQVRIEEVLCFWNE